MSKNNWVVYLVRCSDNSLYCGIPVNGMVCNACGIVQSGETRNCVYYGARINIPIK